MDLCVASAVGAPRPAVCRNPRLCMRGRLCLVWSAMAAHAEGWGDPHAAAWVGGSPSPPRVAAPPRVVWMCAGGDRHGSPPQPPERLSLGERARRPACGAQPGGWAPRGRANHDEHHHFLSCRSRLPGAPASSRGTPRTYSDSCSPWSDVASWRPRGGALLSCYDWAVLRCAAPQQNPSLSPTNRPGSCCASCCFLVPRAVLAACCCGCC